MRLILESFSQFDDMRWEQPANYNLINYCSEDLSSEEKLLTHWLCYITDRQTDFRRIWEVGGYVISHLVRAYVRENEQDVHSLLRHYYIRSNGKLALQCCSEGDNARLKRYGITVGEVRFTSRYMPEDILLMYRTLRILDICSGRSLSRFIGEAIDEHDDQSLSIRRVAVALNALTYGASGTVSAKQFDARIRGVDSEVHTFPSLDPQQQLFERKRLWCSLRDYLKSPEFNPLLVEGLRRAGFARADEWQRTAPSLKKALRALELPGDVWNNSRVFRQGLFSPYLRNERKSWDMPRTIRAICELLPPSEDPRFYPEQLDVTFDFVPRMCERDMCSVCLFGAGVEQLCHRNSRKLCSVSLVHCGYSHRCDPRHCTLKDDAVRGFCHSSTTATSLAS